MEIFLPIIGVVGFLFMFYLITQLRKVVPTNEVHIIQQRSKSVPYGRGLQGGNVYLSWPSWMPLVGIYVQKLQLSIFDLQLSGYKAYDCGKVPFQVDVTAFFYIAEPVIAAEKISNMDDLMKQLEETLKGVIRKVLASKDIIEIMDSRKAIKDEFYQEVYEAVKAWGVDLKNVEFMDIRDDEGSKVITNIMNKKKSQIESESEIEVAENEKRTIIEKENKASEARAQASKAKSLADIIESDAQREAELKRIENDKLTQNQDIEKERILAIQKEQARQNLYESQRVTKEKELSIKQLEQEKNAEIDKNIELIKADEQKQKSIISAEGEKAKVELQAQADKIKVELEAGAEKMRIESIGLAKAKEIDYMGTAQAKTKAEMAKSLNMFSEAALMFMMKELDVNLAEIVDLEKAKALSKANVKIISTGANGGEGINNFMDLFSAKGGTNIGAMMQGVKNTIGEEKMNNIIKNFSKNIPHNPPKNNNNNEIIENN